MPLSCHHDEYDAGCRKHRTVPTCTGRSAMMAGESGRGQSADTVDELVRAFDEHDELNATDRARELVAHGCGEAVLEAAADHASTNRPALTVLVGTLDAGGIVNTSAGAMLLARASVADAAQDSLISIVESIDSYRGGSRFSSWAHTIVQRRVVDYLRRQRESTPLDDEHSPTVRMSSMIATQATVRDALGSLRQLSRARD